MPDTPSSPARRVLRRGLTARDLALVAVFAALLAVLSMPFAIPVGPVPITLQTLGVMLAPAIIGAKRGSLSILAFLALTLAGLPLLPGGRGGVEPFLGPTGGYLLGWVAGALVIGLLSQTLMRRYRFWGGFLINIVGGIGVIYLVGVPWSALYLGDTLIAGILGAGFFLPGDLAKAVLAAAIAHAVHRAYPVPLAGRRVVEADTPATEEPAASDSDADADADTEADSDAGSDSGAGRHRKRA